MTTTMAPSVMKWTVFIAAAAAVVYLSLLILRPFLGVAAWSTVIAIACYPLHQRIARSSGRAALSAAITSILMVLAVLVPLLLIAGVAINQLLTAGESLRQMLLDPESIGRRVAALLAPLTARIGMDANAVAAWVSGRASEWIAGAGPRTMSAAAGAGSALLSFVLTAITTFLLLRHGDRLIATIPDLLPFERARSEALLVRIRDVVHASMYGVVVIAGIQGLLCGAMFWLLGIPAAALWGLLTMFASVVPLVGTAVVWVPGTVYLLMIGAWPKAVVLALWGAAVVSSVDNFLRPRLVAGRVRLSALAMFIAMLGGLRAFGPLGIILGPMVFATAAEIFKLLRDAPPSVAAHQAASV